MKSRFDAPLPLLLGTGFFLGLNFPLGKLASTAGFNPVIWAAMLSIIPGIMLLGLAYARGAMMLNGQVLAFGAIAALTAYVIPNFVTFSAMPHVGSGYVALMFALSPVFTALLSFALGIRPPDRALMAGMALGFLGAVLIVTARQPLQSGGGIWRFAALLIPASLGAGNVFRTARWPKGLMPLGAAAVANLCTIPFFAVLLWFVPVANTAAAFQAHWLLAGAQCAVSFCMFLLFFKLQLAGGPTYLSQIGYIAAGVGLFFGWMFFAESYPLAVWAGAGLIVLGLLVSALMRR